MTSNYTSVTKSDSARWPRFFREMGWINKTWISNDQ